MQAFIDAMPGWKRAVGQRLDTVIVRAVPDVAKAVKWNSPLYGAEHGRWFLGIHCFTKYIKIAFFDGAALEPIPPVASEDAQARYLHIFEGDTLDERQFTNWVKQASKLPGWRSGGR